VSGDTWKVFSSDEHMGETRSMQLAVLRPPSGWIHKQKFRQHWQELRMPLLEQGFSENKRYRRTLLAGGWL